MALHDRYPRRTPFELVFPDLERAAELAGSVFDEAEARGADPHDPLMFATLGSVAAFLREVQGGDATEATPQPYAVLAFHGVHFEKAGHPFYRLTTAAVRRLVEYAPARSSGARPVPPTPSGYLQMPQHLIWLENGEGESGVPESLDGVFWTQSSDGLLHSMLVTGMRPDRPGIGVVPVPEAPLADAGEWLGATVRLGGEGADFESRIPGASIDGLYGVRTAGEALKLLARFFRFVEGRGGTLEDPSSASPGDAGPTPSVLPCTRISIDG